MEKFRVLLYEEMHEEGKAILREKADIFLAERLDEPYLVDRVREMHGIIVRANGKVSRRVLGYWSLLQGLRWSEGTG